ncbi:MAG: PDZ domain-containing protein [Pirellulales bacterium]|nr:PDZ domain-containing protein [Pirellulales bacterium]
MKLAAHYTLFLAIAAMLAAGANYADAAPSRQGRSNMQRSGKSSYTSSSRKNSSQSRAATQQQKSYRAGNNYKNRTGSKSNNNRRYVTKPQPNHKGGKYNVHPKWNSNGGKQTIGPDWNRKGGKQTIKPDWNRKGGKETGSGGKGGFYPGPKITGPIVSVPGSKGGKDRINPGGRKTPGGRLPGIGGFNPKDVRTLPKIDNLNKGLKDFWKKGNKAKNRADLKAVRQFANKCINAPAPCGWWVDFCCHHWWDYCCYPNYWNCWDHCYWNTVYCPSRLVVVGGVQQVLQEVSYYLGISGSQIPNFGFGIQQIKTGSPAERAGLKQGDVIVSVNGQQMTGEEVLATSMQQSGGVLDLEVVAQGSDTPQMVRVVAEQIQSSSF